MAVVGFLLSLVACDGDSTDPYLPLLSLEATKQEFKVSDTISGVLTNVTSRPVQYSTCVYVEKRYEIAWSVPAEIEDGGCDASSFLLPPRASTTIVYVPSRPLAAGQYRLRLASSRLDIPDAPVSRRKVFSDPFSIVP